MEHEVGRESAILLKVVKPSDVSQLLPFNKQSDDELQIELCVSGRRIRGHKYWPSNRGNYVRNYVFSSLRIEAKATRLRVTWNLEAMWDYLPVDLVFTVFGFLHPIDLYHAIRATKGLRCILLNRNSVSCWKESFLNHPDIPFYPDDISPPKWVSLIFGPATCDNCNMDNCLVEYASRSRKCNDCSDYFAYKNSTLVYAVSSIIGEFPVQLDRDIWELALKIRRPSSFYYPDKQAYDRPPKYSLQQFVEVAREMRRYLLSIKLCAPNAESNYEAFVKVKKAAVQDRDKHAQFCNFWAYNIHEHCYKAFLASVYVFRDVTAKNVLLKRGHELLDIRDAQNGFISNIINSWCILSDSRLSKSNLWKYLPILESMVVESRKIRLKAELAHRIQLRQTEITAFYNHTTKGSLTYQMLTYIPQPSAIFGVKFFANYINDSQNTVVELDLHLAQAEVLRFVGDYIDAKKRRLLKLLLEVDILPEGATEDSEPGDFLGLAIAIFECCGKTFVGWEDVAAHRCKLGKYEGWIHRHDPRDSSFMLRFSETGYEALKNIAGLLHLSLESILAKDLDAMNKRFICKMCPFGEKAHIDVLLALTWRECLDHAVELRDRSSSEALFAPSFDVLSETLTANIMVLEAPFPPPGEPIWSCKHCSTYIEPFKRTDALTHAYKVHGISKAVAGVDFDVFRDDRVGNSPTNRPQYLVRLHEHANLCCLRCPMSYKLHRKKDPDLHQHFLDLHGIESSDVVEGVHWMRIKVVEDDGWIQEKILRRQENARNLKG